MLHVDEEGPGSGTVVGEVRRTVVRALTSHDRVVLAVSGGRDSMVLLDAAVAGAPRRLACVATFDHGTGAAATLAAEHVVRCARELGVAVVIGRAEPGLRGEAAWRRARWDFLHSVSARERAPVATAHTMDDQLETVLMRVLRGAGARGLAGLYAGSATVRPLLDTSRAEVVRYAEGASVRWVEDPSNSSRAHLRNRVRLDLLPALQRAAPTLGGDLLRIARRAAAWRASVDDLVAERVPFAISQGTLQVARAYLCGYDAREIALIWTSLAARMGIALDRRGTSRLSAFTNDGDPGARIQLSGGYEVILHRGAFHLRHTGAAAPAGAARDAQKLVSAAVAGAFRFRTVRGSVPVGRWQAALPDDAPVEVREWRPGDRMVPAGSSVPRRVKGLLRDAGVDGARRGRWPVVLVAGEIVWVPGVRRSEAATVRSGRPFTLYECERLSG
ncbi:MAG: tRNA lysidine(34) synthetase TilS [Gemmatimonadaceae bacterium]